MRGSRKFFQGVKFIFLVFNLFYTFTEGFNGLFLGKVLLFKVPGCVQHFPGCGVQLFPGGGGGGGGRVQILISMETYRTCDFPLSVQNPYPPSGSAHDPHMKT